MRDGRAALRLVERLSRALPGSRRDTLPPLGIAEVSHACAGYPLYAAGLTEAFRLYAESFARQVEHYPLLVTSCSACTWLLRVGYPEHGVPLGPQVQHITELLAPYAEALPITRSLPAIAAYHDPCHLGRRLGSLPATANPTGPARQAHDGGGEHGGPAELARRPEALDLFDAPRRLLERATRGVIEFPYHHEGARCCGAGGLMPVTEPEIAQAMAQDRFGELQSGPVPEAPSLVVTGCPGCQHHLATSRPARGSGAADARLVAAPVQVQVRSLIELLEEATRPEGSAGSERDGAS